MKRFIFNVITSFVINCVTAILASIFFPGNNWIGIFTGVLGGMIYIIFDIRKEIRSEHLLNSWQENSQNNSPRRSATVPQKKVNEFDAYFSNNTDVIKTITYIEQKAMLELLERMKYTNLNLDQQKRGRIKYFYINNKKEVFDMNDRISNKKILYKSSVYNTTVKDKLVL